MVTLVIMQCIFEVENKQFRTIFLISMVARVEQTFLQHRRQTRSLMSMCQVWGCDMRNLNVQIPLQSPCGKCSEGRVYSKKPEPEKLSLARKMLQVTPKEGAGLKAKGGTSGTWGERAGLSAQLASAYMESLSFLGITCQKWFCSCHRPSPEAEPVCPGALDPAQVCVFSVFEEERSHATAQKMDENQLEHPCHL